MGRAPIGSRRRLGLALAMAPCLALAAGADPIPVPKRDYAAELDIHVVRNGEPRRIRGKLYWSPDRQRTEIQRAGHSSIVILREDKGVTWSLAPLQQTYVEKPLEEEQSRAVDRDFDLERALAAGDATLRKLDRQTVNGVETTRYEMQLKTAAGATASGHIWLSDDDVTVRIEAFWARGDDAGRFQRDLRNIEVGPLAPALFEVPEGYAKFTPPEIRPEPKPLPETVHETFIEEMQEQAIKDSNR